MTDRAGNHQSADEKLGKWERKGREVGCTLGGFRLERWSGASEARVSLKSLSRRWNWGVLEMNR